VATLVRLIDSSKAVAIVVMLAGTTHSTLATGTLPILATLPVILLGPWVGSQIDRRSPKASLRTGVLIEMLLLGSGLLTLIATGVSLALCLALALAMGIVQTLTDNATNTLLPVVVNGAQLERANGLLSSGQGIARVAAPSGAAVLAVVSPVGLMALWLLLAACALVLLRFVTAGAASGAPSAEARTTGTWRTGLSWLRAHPAPRSLLACVFANNLAFGMQAAVLLVFMISSLGLERSHFGVVGSTVAVAGIVGNLVVAGGAERVRLELQVIAALIVQTVGFVLVATSSGMVTVLIGSVLLGLSSGVWNVVSSTAIMRLAPQGIRGSILSSYRSVAFSAVPLGGAAGGLLGVFDPRAALVAAAGLSVVSVALSRRITLAGIPREEQSNGTGSVGTTIAPLRR